MNQFARSFGEQLRSPRLAPVYAALAHGSRMVLTLVIIKLISVYSGPAGLAQLGFFMSIASIVAVFAGGGISNGIIKYVAEYRGSPIRLVRFLGCALLYGGLFSLLFLGLSLIFASNLSEMVFEDVALWWVMPIFGLAQLLAFIGVMTVSFFNGVGRQGTFAWITILANLGSIVVAFVLISQYNVVGGALALALVTASVGCVSLVVIFRSGILRILRPRYQSETFRQLLRYSLMMVSAATFFPVTEILVRSQIVSSSGLDIAGLWQGLFRFSGTYIGFFSVVLTTTVMPRLASTAGMYESRQLVIGQMVRIGVVFAVCAGLIYQLRENIILFVFSESFLPIADVIAWHLIGDLFRILSYVVGVLLVAKAAVRLFVFAEFLQFGLYLAISSFFISQGGSIDVIAQCYSISYGLYLVFMMFILFRFTRRQSA
jgi:PST family polysaccharide transporter/antigen flippase